MTCHAGSITVLLSTICVLAHHVHSQSVYPAAQFRDPDYRERWNHDYRRSFVRRRGPFGVYPQSWEQTTMDPLSRFHYPGIRGSRGRRPIAIETDSHNGHTQADYDEHNSTEAQFMPMVQRRKLIRPRKPPLIPLQREEQLTPFRYTTNNGNYRQPVHHQVQHHQAEQTTTDGPRETTSEETTETKSYVGLPGYWKPIRVPPYGYNYPRWYHVQRTKGAPEPEEKDEEQSIEQPPTTSKPPTTEGSTSYEDVTEGATTEQAQQLLGLGYRPAPYPSPHHFQTHIQSHHPHQRPNRYPSPQPPPPPPPHYYPRPSPYPSTASLSYHRESPSTYPPSSPPSTPMDYHTWLRRQHELMVQSADEEATTPPAPTTPLQPVETTEVGTMPSITVTGRPTIIFPTSAPTPRSSTAPISPSPETEPANTLSTSETSTFYTNVSPSRPPLQDVTQSESQSTFIGPVRRRPGATQANRDDRGQQQQPHHHHHQYHHHQHQHHRQSPPQDRSEEQQRSASEVELTIRTHQGSSGQQDEHERLKAGEVAGMVIGIVSLIATIVGCVTFLILKKPLATCEDPPFPTPEPTITSIQRTFPGGAMYSGEEEPAERAEDSPPPPPGPYPPGHRKNLMQPIPEWSYSPASSIRLSFEEVHQAVQQQQQQQQQQSQAPSRASMNVAADQRERPGGYI